MLSQNHRMSQAAAREVFVRGGTASLPHFVLKLMKLDGLAAVAKIEPVVGAETRFAVSISKKVAPTAVARNRTRRRVYSVLRDLLPRIAPGFLVGISVKKGGESLSFEEIRAELVSGIEKTPLLS